METYLYKVSKLCWAVKNGIKEEPEVFQSVDDACNFLESTGVPDEQIDLALINLVANGTSRARFGGKYGNFLDSDNEKLDGPVGVA